ncbi:MAG: Holliday junction resolvase RuvX [Planctomycetota bacterium]
MTAAVAVDHGAKKTGLAACDALRISARALPVARVAGDAAELVERVAAEVDERSAASVVIGLPIRASGEEGERAPAIRAFAAQVARACPRATVVLVDEALTSKAADERMRDADVPRDERKDWRDSYAALVLLEDWLSDGGVRGERVEPAEPPRG